MKRILSETTSIGVRYYPANRCILPREILNKQSIYGEIQVKCVAYPDGRMRCVPEYDICKKIALEKNLPIQLVYDTILREIAND